MSLLRNPPLVSCIMITGKTSDRAPLARASLRAFLRQTWTNRELVIINDGDYAVLSSAEESQGGVDGYPVRELRVQPQRSLGELRNLGLATARGDWLIQWDDDDWSHAERISQQMAFAKPGCAVVLRQQVRYSFPSNTARQFAWRYPSCRGIPGTVLHPRCAELSYPALARHEDTRFLQEHFPGSRTVVLENDEFPQLYLRFYHGNNTWDEQHIMGQLPPGHWELDPPVAKYLQRVLRENYQLLSREVT